MSDRVDPIRTGPGAGQPAGHNRAVTRLRSVSADGDTRYAGAVSLAAALGGILWGVDRARPR